MALWALKAFQGMPILCEISRDRARQIIRMRGVALHVTFPAESGSSFTHGACRPDSTNESLRRAPRLARPMASHHRQKAALAAARARAHPADGRLPSPLHLPNVPAIGESDRTPSGRHRHCACRLVPGRYQGIARPGVVLTSGASSSSGGGRTPPPPTPPASARTSRKAE